MSEREDKIREFQAWVAQYVTGDEKGESHVFLERLFKACGYDGYREAGATFEYRIRRKGHTTKYADLVWAPKLLLEMKKRGEKLGNHRDQIFNYWIGLTPDRPRYVILCNFDEFWIYDFNLQIEAPVDIIALSDLDERYEAISFLFPDPKPPVFKYNFVDVTREAADKVAQALNSIIERGQKQGDIDRETAQRFILQCVFALFAEDIGLLPHAFFTRLLDECVEGASSYDLLGGLFRQMDKKLPAKAGRYKDIRYFNGGLFAAEAAVELTKEELMLLREAAEQKWNHVQPAIFGTIFEESVLEPKRHALGAHFTREADIAKVVIPTIEKPWRERIEAANFEELLALRKEIAEFKVLDPACGSGNFLYVAYRFLKRIEADLLNKIWTYKDKRAAQMSTVSLISTKQFFGIDINPFAVELAKVTLIIAKKLATDEYHDRLDKKIESKEGTEDKIKTVQLGVRLELDEALPLDNLDANFSVEDAVLAKWPSCDAIIGNPPYQALNKAEKNLLKAAQQRYPKVEKRADYCVYWFRRAHDHLPNGARAGLIGTNSIRQTTSRKESLDYITKGGTITEAVASQVWPGEAVVHVSIVNWIKGKQPGKKFLYMQDGDHVDSPWEKAELDEIHGGLSFEIDLSSAIALAANGFHQSADKKLYGQGQTHNHEGFLLTPKEAAVIAKDKESAKILRPYLIGDDLLGDVGGIPSRYAIDLNHCPDLTSAQRYRAALQWLIDKGVLATAEKNAAEQIQERIDAFLDSVKKNPKVHSHLNLIEKHIAEYVSNKQSVLDKFPSLISKLKLLNTEQNLALDSELKALGKSEDRFSHLKNWWHYWRDRDALIKRIETKSRYIVCSRHLRRPIFEFVDPQIRPNDALQTFVFEDDYSFGILHSRAHALWFTERSGSIKRDSRYTPTKAFQSFPWPQNITLEQTRSVAWAATKLRNLRWSLMKENNWNFRQLYELFEQPGANKLREAHLELDNAVRIAYGMTLDEDPLSFLLELNSQLAAAEKAGKTITGPGLPSSVKNPESFITKDKIFLPKIIGK